MLYSVRRETNSYNTDRFIFNSVPAHIWLNMCCSSQICNMYSFCHLYFIFNMSMLISCSFCFYRILFFFLSHFSFSAFTFLSACGLWQSFQPSYPGSVDVRPGLIDQTINCPCITSLLLILCLTSRLRPYRGKKRGVGCRVEWGGRESLQQIVN